MPNVIPPLIPTPPQRPTVGRVVHYYMKSHAKAEEPYGPYAAIVCATKAEDSGLKGDFSAVLKVFEPGKGDAYKTAEFSSQPTGGCWSWPPRV